MSGNSNSILRSILTGSAWSFIGVILALAFFYWQEYRNPYDFKIELVDDFNLIEVREKINDLKLLYKEEDIIKNKKEIKVVRIRLKNNGDTILQSYYDQLEPFGLRFTNSNILNAEITSSNSSDLKKKLINHNVHNDETLDDDLIFSKVIFDKNDFAILKITLLSNSDKIFEITPLGKIANIESLKIESIEPNDKKTTPVQVYFIGGYFGLLLFLIGLISIITLTEIFIKKRKISKFRENEKDLTVAQEKIVDLYKGFNYSTERMISALLKNDYALDFAEIIKAQEPKRSPIVKLILLPLLFSSRKRFQSLPKEVFEVNGTTISFNTANEEFIKNFFGQVL